MRDRWSDAIAAIDAIDAESRPRRTDMSADDRDETIEVQGRDDGSWDVVRRGEQDEVLSNHPLQSMAESERHRLAQEQADDDAGPGDDDADLGTIASYPDNTGG